MKARCLIHDDQLIRPSQNLTICRLCKPIARRMLERLESQVVNLDLDVSDNDDPRIAAYKILVFMDGRSAL